MLELNPFKQIPVGRPIPESLHAVSLSLPTMAHVRGYEERLPSTVEHIRSGYPRFVTHHLIEESKQHFLKKNRIEGKIAYCLNSQKAASGLLAFAGAGADVRTDRGITFVLFDAGSEAVKLAHSYLQHTGVCISSRCAEDYLIAEGVRPGTVQAAETDSKRVLEILGEAHKTSQSHVHLATSGMNAFFTVFRGLQEIQATKGRTLWLQLGWLYVDTGEIIKKFTAPSDRAFMGDVFDMGAIRDFVSKNSDRIAGIVTECPTNPLVEMTDLQELHAITRSAGAALILDPTLVTPLNVEVLVHSDAVINSLTKYASHMGDVMIGSAVLNPASPFYKELSRKVETSIENPYPRDLARLAEQIENYHSVVAKINANTMRLATYLSNHKNIKKVYWAYAEQSRKNYEKFQRRAEAPGGIITIELNIPLEKFYDRITVAKGPSFGSVFTILCPFMYLAHYDLVQSEAGRRELASLHLDPDLVRVSVGIEPIEEIIAAFAEALSD